MIPKGACIWRCEAIIEELTSCDGFLRQSLHTIHRIFIAHPAPMHRHGLLKTIEHTQPHFLTLAQAQDRTGRLAIKTPDLEIFARFACQIKPPLFGLQHAQGRCGLCLHERGHDQA